MLILNADKPAWQFHLRNHECFHVKIHVVMPSMTRVSARNQQPQGHKAKQDTIFPIIKHRLNQRSIVKLGVLNSIPVFEIPHNLSAIPAGYRHLSLGKRKSSVAESSDTSQPNPHSETDHLSIVFQRSITLLPPCTSQAA